MRNLGILALIILPWLFNVYQSKTFIKHYASLSEQTILISENMYFLGCAEAGYPDVSECRDMAKARAEEIRTMLENQ